MKAFKLQKKGPPKRKHETVDLLALKSAPLVKKQVLSEDQCLDQRIELLQELTQNMTETENDQEISLDSFLNTLPDVKKVEGIEIMNVNNHEEEYTSSAPKPATELTQNIKSISKIDKIVPNYSTLPFQKKLSPSSDGEVENTNHLVPIKDWVDAGLPIPFMKVISAQNFAAPTSIQAESLPIIMSGYDLVGIAPTGSGKTVAFVIPMCRHVAANLSNYSKMGGNGPFAVVLVPTRELCKQICAEIEPWASALQLKTLACYGGSNIATQIGQILSEVCHIIVATPGRLIDLLLANGGRIFSLKSTTFLVIDETDRMFDMGFGPQVRKIVETIRPDRQTVVFSATMSPAMGNLVNRILDSPINVTVGKQATVPLHVKQYACIVSSSEKFELLKHCLETNGFLSGKTTGSVIIFTNTQVQANYLSSKLFNNGIVNRKIHGGLEQNERDDTLNEFRLGKFRVLVATSVAARGIDVKQVKLVINYDAASHLEDYIHRAGRTGRDGDSGTCISFIEPEQVREAFQLSQCFDFVQMDKEFGQYSSQLTHMASTYAENAPEKPKMLGFGGHGLAKLNSKWRLQRSLEQRAYGDGMINDRDSSLLDDTEEIISIVKQGGLFIARLLINNAPQVARVAVTAVALHTIIIEKYHVSLTQKGVYRGHVPPNTPEDSLLHLQIESESKEDVLGAYRELQHVLQQKSSEAREKGRYSTF